MGLASTFLSLTIAVALPMAIVAMIFHIKKLKPANVFLVLLNLLAIGLIIGAFVNSILGLSLSEEAYSYYNTYTKSYVYYPEYTHPCSWVAMGLGIGAIVVSLIVMLATFGCISARRRARRAEQLNRQNQERETERYARSLTNAQFQRRPEPVVAQPVKPATEKPTNGMDYIEEIKRLKELLDSGAITQEEFDQLKKRIFERS